MKVKLQLGSVLVGMAIGALGTYAILSSGLLVAQHKGIVQINRAPPVRK